MVDVTSEEPRSRASRRTRMLTSAALGLIGVAAVAVLLTSSEGMASPVSVANAFMEARDNLDAEATLALFAADIPISDGFLNAIMAYPLYFDWLRTSDWRWSVGDCAEISTGQGGTLMRCDYLSENDWTRALDHPPVSGFLDILVTDGEITGLIHTGELAQFAEVWGQVTAWIETNHPDTLDQVLTPDLRRPVLNHPNSIALWGQYTDEFVASVEEG